jgi:hypothetical protein
MKNKILLIIFIILAIAASVVSCTKVNFDDLNIIAESVANIEAGEYTLDYTIDKLEKYTENFDLIVSVKVFDDNNRAVNVENNRTFDALTDNVYYVTVYVKTMVNGKYQTKSKSYTITTIKTDPKLVLKLIILGNDYDHSVINLTYGQSYEISNLPDFPIVNPMVEGYDLTITDKYWVVRDIFGIETRLTQQHLNDITKATTIYAYYDIKQIPKQCTLIFNTNGGNTIEPITQTYGSSVTRPADPIKEGHYFLGWHNDNALLDLYSWTNASPMPTDRTLHAKWLKDNGGNHEYFNFTYTFENTGYGYYSIAAKSGITLPSHVVIPNGYQNMQVKTIDEGAFQNRTELQSIVVPDTITAIGFSAFAGCVSLSEVDLTSSNIDRLNSKLFENCNSLTSLIVPNSVTNIIYDAFLGCENLENLYFTKESKLRTLSANTFANTKISALQLPYYMKGRFSGDINISVSFFEEIIND